MRIRAMPSASNAKMAMGHQIMEAAEKDAPVAASTLSYMMFLFDLVEMLSFLWFLRK